LAHMGAGPLPLQLTATSWKQKAVELSAILKNRLFRRPCASLESIMVEAWLALSSGEFSLLRPSFQEDEIKLILGVGRCWVCGRSRPADLVLRGLGP